MCLFISPITLWVIGCIELERSAQKAPQLCPEVAGELGVPVTNHFVRNTKKPYYLIKKEIGTLWSTKCTLPNEIRSQVNIFSKAVNVCEDCIQTRTQW